MSSDFVLASSVTRDGDLTFSATVPDGWQQGRGAFGGLVLGTLLRAVERAEPDGGRAARVLSGDLCGPVLPGAAKVAVRALRRGSNQSNWACELTQGDQVLATANAVLSPPRTSLARTVLPVPAPVRWEDVAPVAVPAGGPRFAAHYEYRAIGAAFGATGEAACDGFVCERVPLGRVDAPALVARLDAWWPTLFQLDGVLRPVATVSFTAEILVDPASLPPTEPLRYRARMAALHDGFFVEMRELWHDGRVVALNQQTFAILA